MKFENLDKPYFIGEIGINHNGDIQIAKQLIDISFGCGWDSVKFQKRNPDKCVPEAQKSQLRETPWGQMTYIEYKHKIEFGNKEYDFIDEYCKEKPIQWSASIWDYDSLDFLLNYDVPYLKIPSALNNNYDFIIECCKTNKPIILSSGMCELNELDDMVNLLNKHSSNFCLLHTNSAYPCKHEDINLSLIPFYIDRYKCPIGYSGHEEDLEPTIISVLLGAKVIERHITINHDLWGTDQKSSLEPSGMWILKRRTDILDKILGSPIKKVFDSEKPFIGKLKK